MLVFQALCLSKVYMEYIPVENRDTRYDLWYIRYQCRVPFIQTLSLEQLEEDGLPTSGDKHHDHAMQWEPKLISIPIHRMAELWSSGANISLVNKSDAPKIYEAISRHLFAWKHHIENSYNPSKVPHDDLLILDQFATIIYDHASTTYDENLVDDFRASSRTSISRSEMLSSMAKADRRRVEDAEKGITRLRNIDFMEAVPKYDPDAPTTLIDYSGRNKNVVAPVRNSLSSFFKKGKM